MTARTDFRVVIERTPERVCLTITGDLDLAAVPALGCARDKAMEGTADLLVDLRGVDFIDSSGLKFLLQTERAAREQVCHLSLLRPAASAMRVFVITGAEQHLPFVDSDPALRSQPII